MSYKFNPGDVVRLKSSTMPMTVDSYDELGKVRCVWFEGATLNRGVFQEVVLELNGKGTEK